MKMDDYNKAMTRLEISDQCEERLMDMIQQEKKIKRHINKKAVMLSILAAAVACGSIGTAAAFGGLRRNQEVWEQEREYVTDNGKVLTYSYDKFDHNNYDMLASVAEAIPEGEASAQTEKISISAEDVFCDGRYLYCNFKAETDMPGTGVMRTSLIVTVNGQEYRMPTQDTGTRSIDMVLLSDETEPGIFYGSLNFLLPEILTETPEISVTCKSFQCYDTLISPDKHYVGRIPDWVTVDIPVTIQSEALHNTEVNYEGTALKVQSVEHSPSGIAVTYSHQEVKNGVICIYDENGNSITRKTGVDGYIFTEDWVTEFFEASDTSSITIRLVDSITNPLETVDEVTVSLH